MRNEQKLLISRIKNRKNTGGSKAIKEAVSFGFIIGAKVSFVLK